MNNEFGLKELYDLTLKTTYPIEMEGRVFETGEVIARFDKIQLANFREITSRASAKGGQGDVARIVWEDPKEIQLNFTQGIFSKRQFALLSNGNLINSSPSGSFFIPAHFSGESDGEGKVFLGKNNVQKVFIYDAETGQRIYHPNITQLDKGIIKLHEKYCNVEIDYEYLYENNYTTLTIGQKLIQGFLCLEGKSRVKDDITGKTHTVLLRIPRLKLVSDLSMRLGRETGPLLANFAAVGYPQSSGKDRKIMELFFLNDDIDAEM